MTKHRVKVLEKRMPPPKPQNRYVLISWIEYPEHTCTVVPNRISSQLINKVIKTIAYKLLLFLSSTLEITSHHPKNNHYINCQKPPKIHNLIIVDVRNHILLLTTCPNNLVFKELFKKGRFNTKKQLDISEYKVLNNTVSKWNLKVIEKYFCTITISSTHRWPNTKLIQWPFNSKPFQKVFNDL